MAKTKRGVPHIDRQWCKGCGICVHFCPKKVLALDEKDKAVVVSPALCVACRLCELRCPDLAVTVTVREEDSPPAPPAMGPSSPRLTGVGS